MVQVTPQREKRPAPSVDRRVLFMVNFTYPGPEVIKLFACSTQLSPKFFVLINDKMPTKLLAF